MLLAMEAIGVHTLGEALEYQRAETLRLARGMAANGDELRASEEGQADTLRRFNPMQPNSDSPPLE